MHTVCQGAVGICQAAISKPTAPRQDCGAMDMSCISTASAGAGAEPDVSIDELFDLCDPQEKAAGVELSR